MYIIIPLFQLFWIRVRDLGCEIGAIHHVGPRPLCVKLHKKGKKFICNVVKCGSRFVR